MSNVERNSLNAIRYPLEVVMRLPNLILSLAFAFVALPSLNSEDLSRRTLADQPEDQQTAVREILKLGGDWEAPSKTVLIGFIGDKFTADKFALLSPLTDVWILYLHQVPADDDAFKHCAPLVRLRDVQIQACKFTGTGFRHLVKCERLERLLIEDTPITDDGLAEIAKLSSLKTLDITNWSVKPKITHKGVIELAKLENLKSLSVTMSAVPDGLKEKLQKALPECKIWLDTFEPESENGG